MWAVLLGLLLILVAATSTHAAMRARSSRSSGPTRTGLVAPARATAAHTRRPF
jgi:hypothetical protein